jgi:lipopolysaccharide heptosyltransferase I
MDSILFVKTSSLGDVVHHMPAVTDARKKFPTARLSWVVEELFEPLARLHPAVDAVIPVATRRWRSRPLAPATWGDFAETMQRLREERFDRIIDTQGLIRSALIARRAAGQHHGYDAASIKEPLASRFYDVKHRVARDLHAVTRNRALTAAALGYQPDEAIDYGLVRPAQPGGVRQALLLHGTSRPSKQWSESHWTDLGRWLRREGFEVALLWGSDDERRRAERLANAIPEAHVLDRAPLDIVALHIARSSLVVGGDTGLLHLAAAYRVPLVAVFTGSDPALTGPVGSGPIRVVGGANERPEVNEVIAAVKAVLRA